MTGVASSSASHKIAKGAEKEIQENRPNDGGEQSGGRREKHRLVPVDPTHALNNRRKRRGQ